ncbi:MAG: hypothetical protein HYY17_10940 [Planctomycetes bacterium]|nr:hypothetical protein [Planctomycetota bacterium]
MDEIEPAIADPEERLGIRLKGNPVPGFNAKGYPFFWECVFFEICESMPGGFPRPEFEEEFRGKHLPTGGAYKLGLMSAELRVYHECFERELQDPQVRDPLLEAVARLAPSEAKSVLFRILLDRSEVRIPADMLAICARMVVDAEENTLDRYFIVRMLRSTETPERVEVLRNAFFLEMSLQSPDYGIGIACEALEGLLSVEPGELSQNSATRHFALRLVAKAAAAEDLQNQFEVLVRAILSADVSVRTDLEALALSLASTSPSGAAKLKALLGEPIPAKK